MSFTYQPYDWSPEAFSDTHSFIQNNADATFFYFDDGVPWIESLNRDAFHENVSKDIHSKAKEAKKTRQVFVGTNFLGKDRATLAPYWKEKDSLELPDAWAQKTLDDPKVINAYTNYCKRMIETFEPDIYVYGMEVDSIMMDPNEKNFRQLHIFLDSVYKALKQEFPQTTLVLTFVLLPEENMQSKLEMIKALLPYTDVYAVSLYPYLFDGIAGDSSKLSNNLFSQVRGYIGNKPFAVAETGFNAKDWKVLSRLIWIEGNETSQDNYLRFLLEESAKLEAVFINWWVPRDLDYLWKKMKAAGADSMLSQWNSNGLLDAHGNKRKSFYRWKNWYQKEVQRNYSVKAAR